MGLYPTIPHNATQVNYLWKKCRVQKCEKTPKHDDTKSMEIRLLIEHESPLKNRITMTQMP